MVMFLAHIGLALHVIALIASISLLLCVEATKLMKFAAYAGIVLSISGTICIAYYSIIYLTMGHFEHAYSDAVTVEHNKPFEHDYTGKHGQ